MNDPSLVFLLININFPFYQKKKKQIYPLHNRRWVLGMWRIPSEATADRWFGDPIASAPSSDGWPNSENNLSTIFLSSVLFVFFLPLSFFPSRILKPQLGRHPEKFHSCSLQDCTRLPESAPAEGMSLQLELMGAVRAIKLKNPKCR